MWWGRTVSVAPELKPAFGCGLYRGLKPAAPPKNLKDPLPRRRASGPAAPTKTSETRCPTSFRHLLIPTKGSESRRSHERTSETMSGENFGELLLRETVRGPMVLRLGWKTSPAEQRASARGIGYQHSGL